MRANYSVLAEEEMNHNLAMCHYREHQRMVFEKILAASIEEEAELRATHDANAKTVSEALKLRVAINAMQNGLKDLGNVKHDHHFCEICVADTSESENL